MHHSVAVELLRIQVVPLTDLSRWIFIAFPSVFMDVP